MKFKESPKYHHDSLGVKILFRNFCKPKRPLFSTSPYAPPKPVRPSLNVRESAEKGMYVAGLEHETVVTPEEASECLRRGNEQRATAATG